MMLADQIRDLLDRGLQLSEESGQIRVKGRSDILTPETRLFLSENKEAILHHLRQDATRRSASLKPILPLTDKDPHTPLSFGQSRLWFLQQLEPTTSVYHINGALEFRGNLNKDALEEALNEIVRRHETLRTSFPSRDGVPFQSVARFEPKKLQIENLRDLSADQRKANVERHLHDVMHTPFDLTSGPLFRTRLLNLEPRRWLLVVSMHHIIADGTSINVFADELGALYRQFAKGHKATLPDLPIQYRDFTHWQQSVLGEELLKEQLAYWRDRLSESPALTTLTPDFARPAHQSYRGAVERFNLDQRVTDGLRQLGRHENVTLFATVLAAFGVYISKYVRQSDVVIGTPVANRPREELQNLIGFFANTLPLRLNIDGTSTFRDLIRQTSQMLSGAFENQDLPFEQMVSELSSERDSSHSPLCQTLLVLRKEPLRHLKMDEVEVVPTDHGAVTAKFDTTLELEETAEGINGYWEYATDLYKPKTVHRMIAHLKTLLAALVEQPDVPTRSVSLATESERLQLVRRGVTRTEYPRNASIHALFEQQANATPDAVATVYQSTEWSYDKLNKAAGGVAELLNGQGIQANEKVGIYANRSHELIAALLGTLKSGAAYVPLDPDYPAERLRFMIDDTRVRIVLTTRDLFSRLQELIESTSPDKQPSVIVVDQIQNHGEMEVKQGVSVPATTPAYCMYTSGSTGRPKGTLVSHRSVVRLVKNTNFLDLSADQVFLQFAPISFDASTLEIWGPLLNGGRLVIASQGSLALEELVSEIQNNGVTTLWLTAGLFHVLVDEHLDRLGGLRQLLAGGDVLSVAHVNRMRERHPDCRLINGYGPTENTTFTCCYEIPAGGIHERSVPIGRPIANSHVYIVDDAFRPVPIGVPGELLAGGDGLAQGYLNRDDLTSEKFIPDPITGRDKDRVYRTGDLARYLPSGDIEFLGRLDDQAKIRGFRVEPRELEAVLNTHPLVREAIAVVIDRPNGRKELTAYVVYDQPDITDDQISSIRLDLKSQLPDYMLPASITRLDSLPLNVNGKVDRSALPTPTAFHSQSTHVKAGTVAEEKLCQIWSEVLGVGNIGIHDNFFDLGGDSIQSIQIVSRARLEGIHITPRIMFKHQTVADLALAATKAKNDEPGLQPSSDNPWTPIQRWFQELNLPNPSHFNQAIWLELDEVVSPGTIQTAIQTLIQHHPALRTCYRQEEGVWTHEVKSSQHWEALRVVRPDNNQSEPLEALMLQEAQHAQANLDPTSGLVVRSVYIDLSDKPSRLLLVIHHLAVDGVSWRILLEDLSTAIVQLESGQEISLAPATSAPEVYASRIVGSQIGHKSQTDPNRWTCDTSICGFPKDIESDTSGTVATEESVTVKLEAEATEKLLRGTRNTGDTSPHELMVASLLDTHRQRTGQRHLYLSLEGHGRDALPEGVDLSRTVGWFTSLYPVLLEVQTDDSLATIDGVRDSLRRVREGGIGYGLQRYFGLPGHPSDAARPVPEIVFNYLGQIDHLLPAGSPIRIVEGPLGNNSAPENNRPHLLEVNALVQGGCLCFDWRFSTECHRPETIREIAEAHLSTLRKYLDLRAPLDDSPQYQNGALHGLYELSDAPRPTTPSRYPLTHTQAGILFLREIDPDSDAYIFQLRMKISDPFDKLAFRQAWDLVLRRHSALRTSFVHDEDQNLYQAVHSSVSLPWTEEDWSDRDRSNRDADLDTYCQKERDKGFDLEAAPLFRLALIFHESGSFEFVWTCHHAILDGWSVANVLDEVVRIYDSLVTPGAVPQLEAPPSYESYLANDVDGSSIPDRDFWRKELEGVNSTTELRLPSGVHSTDKKCIDWTFELGGKFTETLRECARQNRVTLNTVFQAAWSLVLSQFSGSKDVLFGSTVSGRNINEAGVERMVGLFINTLPTRIKIDSDRRVHDWLSDLQDRQMDRDQHASLGLAELASFTELPGGTPLFDHLLVFENYPIDAALRSGETALDFSDVSVVDHTNYPLSVTVIPGPEIIVKMTYRQAEYAADAIEVMATQLKHFLSEIAGNTTSKVSELPPLPQSVYEQVLGEWNRTDRDYALDETLIDLFEAQVSRTPDAPALIFEDEQITYGELDLRTNRLARRLKANGAGPDSLVGISMDRSIEMVVGLYGILKADAAYVPIDPSYPEDRVRFMLEDSDVSFLLTQERYRSRFSDEEVECLFVDRDDCSDESDAPIVRKAQPHHLAYMIYTSGSTGQPKGVLNTHLGICNRLHWMQEAYPLDETDRVLQKTPFSFDVSVWEFFWPLQVGAALVIAKPDGHLDSRYLARRIVEENVTTIHFVPSMLQIFLEEPSVRTCTSLKNIICSGEALPLEVANACRRMLPGALHNLYGPTEAAVDVSSWACPSEYQGHSIPIGRPIANTSLYILDNDLNPLPVGAPGELHIGGICLARGYHKRPELTSEKFVHNPFSSDASGRLYKTGDLARFHADGNIEYLGRLDHQVKIRGFRVELGEIEALLRRQDEVNECVVHVTEENTDTLLVAYCVSENEARLDTHALRERVRSELPDYMVPAFIVQIESIPLSPNGKVDRRALPSPEIGVDTPQRGQEESGDVEQVVSDTWREVLGVSDIGRRENFFDLGGHSLRLIRVHRKLESHFGQSVPDLINMFNLPTIQAQAQAIKGQLGGSPEQPKAIGPTNGRSLPEERSKDIAVVGIGCRFPGAPNPETFWSNLCNGVESVSFFSDEELIEAGVEPSLLSDPRYVKANAFLPDADRFDADFFGFTPREAALVDPQHRVFLECSWEAFERSGYDPVSYDGRVGVFAGCGANSYILNNLWAQRDQIDDGFQLLLGNDKDYLATRVSYKLNLNGPSLAVQTACSTSLVAIHLACQSLNDGQCDMAIAGGVTLRFPQTTGYLHREGMVFSSDGHCRAFDADADGMIGGDGSGVVILKPLATAVEDGDTILAVVKGSAINNDGSGKVGYTAPSEIGQARAIEEAIATSGVDAKSVGYVEAHGTGTALGDPIEIEALNRIYGIANREPCAIGSVKTNIGHLDAAAGIAGFLKTVLCLRHGQIPPTLHFRAPNPRIGFQNGPFKVVKELTDWPQPEDHPRRAGVSSFGIGGTNVHAILEAPPELRDGSATRSLLPFLISGRDEDAVSDLQTRLHGHLDTHPDTQPGDLAFTLAVGRYPHSTRKVMLAHSTKQLKERLQEDVSSTGERVGAERSVAFMFPGQGAQYVGMGANLYDSEPVFRKHVDVCSDILFPLLDRDLREILFATEDQEHREAELKQTSLTQPALLSVEYSLAQLWMSWGVRPAAMIGHSIGEYTAACLSGVFTVEDALQIVSDRGRLIQALPGGSMLAAVATVADLDPFLDEGLEVAVQNSPRTSVVSGTDEAISKLQDRLRERQIVSQVLQTSHAFHSRAMDPMLDDFQDTLSGVTFGEPQIPYISNVTGDWITASDATDPNYWVRHVREPVRFSDGLSALLAESQALLEVGPGRALNSFARSNPALATSDHSIFVTMPGPNEDTTEQHGLTTILADLWQSGVNVDWKGFFEHEQRHRIELPTYPFKKDRHWIDPIADAPPETSVESRKPLSQWFYCPNWKQLQQESSKRDLSVTTWLVFLDDVGVGESMVERFEATGARVVSVSRGAEFRQVDGRNFEVMPGIANDYTSLIEALHKTDLLPTDILHLWPLDQREPSPAEDMDDVLNLGFYSLVHLARAMGNLTPDILPRIHNTTSNAFSVLGEPIKAISATALGPIAVIPKEFEGFRSRNIDLDIQGDPASHEALWNECTRETEMSISLRHGFRWIRSFDGMDLEVSPDPKLSKGATYLITGGLGGIGYVLARHLVKSVQANVVILGRTPVDVAKLESQKQLRLEELRSGETQVRYYAADVTNPDAIEKVVLDSEKELGNIRGVIHAAGIAGGGMIQQRDLRECSQVLAPKVKGTYALHHVFRNRKLDWMLLCSSTTALLGEFGQMDYAAANAFLDSFAFSHTSPDCPVRAVNWDTWREVGMAAETTVPTALGEARQQILDMGIRSSEGTEVFDRVISSGLPQVVVSTRDFATRLEREATFSPATVEIDNVPRHARPEISSSFETPESKTEEIVAKIWESSLGIEGIGAADDFFELGGHSLLATQVISRIRDACDVDLPMPTFFNHSTVRALADSIDTIRWASHAESKAPETTDQRETFEI